jgi:hypothetical protein
MFTDRALHPLVPRDVHSLIDWIDDRPEVARKLAELDRESQRKELRVLALPLMEARQSERAPFDFSVSRAIPTR